MADLKTVYRKKDGFRLNIEPDVFDPDVYQEDPPQQEAAEPSGDGVQYTYASNGRWTVYVGGAEDEKGRGKDSLQEYLAEIGTSMNEADEVDA
jgi:hypothetical protein